MKKKFKERSKQPEIQKKRQLFLCVLSAMESKDQDDAMSSFQSTCDWVELIDREGLCHVNNDTYLLMESIEVDEALPTARWCTAGPRPSSPTADYIQCLGQPNHTVLLGLSGFSNPY